MSDAELIDELRDFIQRWKDYFETQRKFLGPDVDPAFIREADNMLFNIDTREDAPR